MFGVYVGIGLVHLGIAIVQKTIFRKILFVAGGVAWIALSCITA